VSTSVIEGMLLLLFCVFVMCTRLDVMLLGSRRCCVGFGDILMIELHCDNETSLSHVKRFKTNGVFLMPPTPLHLAVASDDEDGKSFPSSLIASLWNQSDD